MLCSSSILVECFYFVEGAGLIYVILILSVKLWFYDGGDVVMFCMKVDDCMAMVSCMMACSCGSCPCGQ